MKLKHFEVEQWMTQYEHRAVYNMTDTSIQPLSLKDLLKFSPLLENLRLDYGEITGDERLKKEILSLYSSGALENVTMAAGCSQANELVIQTLLQPGDHVISFTPGYQQFYDLPASLGCGYSLIECDGSSGWKPDLKQVEACLKDETKMILINSPNNPTGYCWKQQELEELVKMVQNRKIYILCDEVYRSYNENEPMSISDLYEHGIATGSLSKMFSLSGLRTGWIKAEKEVIDQINYRRDYSLISTGPLTDELACTALKNKDWILQRNQRVLSENKQILQNWLLENSLFSCTIPEHGSVCFLEYHFDMPSKELALNLLEEEGVFFVPGFCFEKEGCLRLGLGQNPKIFKKGLKILSLWTLNCCKGNQFRDMI
jgi:aspartate/methionine/tyrosine aminotransferase